METVKSCDFNIFYISLQKVLNYVEGYLQQYWRMPMGNQ